MDGESAFWPGVLDNPDDDALRMAFARWLEERNHPRSAWIRNPEIVRAMEKPWADPTANLVKRLGEPYRKERITEGLVLMGAGAVPMLASALAGAIRRDDYQAREQIHQILEQIGSAAVGYLSQLRQHLGAEDPAERRAAIEALRFLGPEAGPALPLLRDRLREDDWQIVHEAVQTIGVIGVAAGPAVPDLLAAYDGASSNTIGWPNSETIRREIVKALGNVGPAALAAVRVLMMSFIMDSDVAEEATDILISLGPAVAEPVLQNLSLIDSEEHSYAVSVLAAVAPTELLFRTLDDREEDSYHREAALQALGLLARSNRNLAREEIDAIVRRLVRVLREEERELQNAALSCLKEIGRAATAAIPDFREMLKTASGWLRGRLMTALTALGASDDAVADIETRLRSPEAKERVQAVGDLWQLPLYEEADRHRVIDLLVPLFHDPDGEVRHAAVNAVARMANVDTPGALPALWAVLDDSSAAVRSAAVEGLGRIQENATRAAASNKAERIAASSASAPYLIDRLQDPDPGVRVLAIKALNSWPDRVDIAAALRELLRDRVDPGVLDALAERHTLPSDLLPEVLVLARDQNPGIRGGAVRLLSRIESTPPEGAAILCQALRDRQHMEEVVRGLKRYGPIAAEALPELMALIEGQEVWTEPVVETLVSLGPVVVPSMREWLHADEPTLLYYAAQVLSGLGAAGAEAMPDLVGILLDGTDYDARLMAGGALCQMGPVPVDALPRLVAMTEEREPQLRGMAAQVLGRIGKPAQPALPTLERLLEDGDGIVRHAAIEALAHLAGELPEALPPMRRRLQDANHERRQEAVQALEMLGVDVLVRPHIYPLVQPMLEDTVAEVRDTAWKCVGAMARSLAVVGGEEEKGPTFEDLFTLLRAKLRDPDLEMRNTAAYQVGKLKEAAAAAVPELMEMLDNPETLCTAINALGSIGPPAKLALPRLRQLARGVQNYEGQMAASAVEKIEGKVS